MVISVPLFTGKIADIQNQFFSAIKNVEPKVKNIIGYPALKVFLNYSGTPLIRSPMGPKKLAILTGVRERVRFKRDLKIEVFRDFPRAANVKKSRDQGLAVRFAV